MLFMSWLGALNFVVGVALLALDAAHSFTVGRFEVTSFQTFWVNFELERLFPLRYHLSQWFGTAADSILDLPAAFVAFGLGVALLIIFDGARRESTRKPLFI